MEHGPWIECVEKDRKCILAKDEKAYYIIWVRKGLDFATAEWLEQQGISEPLLKELQLPFDYIPKRALRGVAVSGSTVRQNVILHLKSNKRKLVLQRDYDPDWLDAFFEDLPRFTAPKAKPPKPEDWREAKQDKELFEKLRFVAPACLILGVVGSIGFVYTQHWGFFTLCLLLLGAQFGLLIGMPAYFTYELPKNKKRKHVWELGLPLMTMMIILVLGFRINWLDDRAFWLFALVGIAVAFVICLLVEDFRNQKWALLGVVVFGAVGGWCLLGGANEVYDFYEPASYVLEVEDTNKSSGRRGSNYYCTVTLPDGREERLSISRSLYNDLEVGDLVRVELGEGFFGFEYANVYAYGEGD